MITIVRGGGGGQRVMIEIIIGVNDENDGRPLSLCILTYYFITKILGEGIPTVFIAVAGRSNGLGPVCSGNTTWPVINCPPVKADWGPEDVWSSLRLPSGKLPDLQ